jgi:5-methylcytosine-specific restriction endonuclease McrA
MDVLALSSSYIPVGRIPWQDAICDVLSGRAEILETYADRAIHTVSEVFPMPSVIRFFRKVTGLFHKRSVKFNRKNVWLRDKGHCQYCDLKVSLSEFTYDHVNPLSQGGKTTWDNIVVCCMKCNQRKANRTPDQAKMRVISSPVAPKSLPMTALPLGGGDMPETWKDYLSSHQYWNGSLT